MRRKCKNPKCENPANSDTGMGVKARLCMECYGKRVIMQARTARMERCACGNVAPKAGGPCKRCRSMIGISPMQPVEYDEP